MKRHHVHVCLRPTSHVVENDRTSCTRNVAAASPHHFLRPRATLRSIHDLKTALHLVLRFEARNPIQSSSSIEGKSSDFDNVHGYQSRFVLQQERSLFCCARSRVSSHARGQPYRVLGTADHLILELRQRHIRAMQRRRVGGQAVQ